MENTSKTYAYGRVATADQLHPERKQQLGTVCLLQKMGYTNIKNIGGIAAYTGKVER